MAPVVSELALTGAGGVSSLASLEDSFREKAQEQFLATMRRVSATSGKRPLRLLSATQKLNAITRVNDGESKVSVARSIGVPESTLRGWCKSEHKIRDKARISSTPDSDFGSRASSSGNNQMSGMGTSSLSSKDESVAGPSKLKKVKIEPLSHEDLFSSNKWKMDHVNPLNSLAAVSGRTENNALLTHQINLLSNAQNAANLSKNLLSLSGSNLASAHMGASGSQTVGISTSHMSSTIVPSQYESASKFVKSLPPAAEAPSMPVPASPRKANDLTNGVLNLQPHKRKRDNGCTSTACTSRKAQDKNLILWLLAQQQRLLGSQQAATAANGYNPAARSLNLSVHNGEIVDDPEERATFEEAIDHGEKFFEWLNRCSDPSVTRFQIMQLKTVLDNLTSRKKTASCKRSRQALDNSDNGNEQVLSNNVNKEP